MTQAEQQIVAQRPGEQIRRPADIADAPAHDGERLLGEIDPTDLDPPGAGLRQPGQQHRQIFLAAAGLADHRDMLVEREGEIDRIDGAPLVVAGERQIGDGQLAAEVRDRFRFGQQHLGIDHVGRRELLDDLVVGDPRVLVVLVEIQQLLPR